MIFSVFAKFASYQLRINITNADWKIEPPNCYKDILGTEKIEVRKILRLSIKNLSQKLKKIKIK